MAVPYTFQYTTGNIPLSQLDANFTYFTTSINVSGANTTLNGSLTTGTNLAVGTSAVIGTTLAVGTNATISGNLAVTGTTTFTGGVTIPSVSISGNATFTGTGNRILGDFSNATLTDRVLFKSSTTDGNTTVGVIPNGTATQSALALYDNATPTNSSSLLLTANSTANNISSTKSGTGTYLPLTFSTNGAEKARLDTSGNLGIGNTPSGTYKLEVTGAGYYSGNLTVAGHTTFEGVTSTGATGTGNIVYATRPTMSVTCSAFTFQDPSDNTKQANFSISGNTTATTRTYSLPLITDTLAGLGSVQTFSAAQTFTGGITASGTLSLSGSTTSNITLGSAQTTGTLTLGGTSQSGAIALGQSTVSATTNIQAGITATANTKAINIGINGASGSTTNIALGSATSGSTSTTTIQGSASFAPANAADTYTIGGTTQTGTITLGQSTASQTTNIGAGATTTGNTKTINIGTQGLSGSNTNINLGSTVTGNTTVITFNGPITSASNSTINTGATTTTAISTLATSGTVTIGGPSQSGTITLGQSTTSQTLNIQAAAVISGQTKTINIGTTGASGSTTAIALGSSVSGATSITTVNGVIKHQVYTVATLPSASTSGSGARSFVSDANTTTFAAIVAGGGANPVPVYSDGTNWRIG